MAMLDQPGDESITANALDRRFARGIDIRHENDVGVVETGAEPVKQVSHASIAVRLYDRDHLTVDNSARGLQNRRYLDRMVAVIVDYGDAIPLARLGKAALHAFEIVQRSTQCVVAEGH